MISILIPTIGRDSTIMRALLSAIATSESLVKEILILDNSQSEKFEDFLANNISKLNDDRVSVIKYAERKSMAGSWNSGLYASTQSWILYLHDDDELLSKTVNRLNVELLGDPNDSFICFDYKKTDDEQSITTKRLMGSNVDSVISIVDNCPKFVSTLIKASKLKGIGGWSDSDGYFLDLMGFLKLYKCGTVKFHSDVLGCYWKHENNASSLIHREVGYGDSIPEVTALFFKLFESKTHRKVFLELLVNYVYEIDLSKLAWWQKKMYKINRYTYTKYIRDKAK